MARTSRGLRLRLLDIQGEIRLVREYTVDLDYAAFVQDQGRRHIVQHALLIISEAVRQIPTQLTDGHPEVRWPAIRAFGNVLRHEYFNVDPDVIWDIVENYLADLSLAVEALLASLD